MTLSLSAQKAAARARGLKARQTAPEGAQAALATHLDALLEQYRGATIAGYAAMRDEADPRPALETASRFGPVGLPVVVAKAAPLKFRAWVPGAPMVRGTFGAMIPESGEWIEPEVLIVPLVAFDAQGRRLGYGGGFYDRTLAGLRATRPTRAIGLAFAAQEVPQVPVEPTDQPLDMIVTEAGARAFAH